MAHAALALLPLWLVAAALAWGAWLRLIGVRDNLLFGDEFSTLQLLGLDYASIASTYDRFGSGLALPLLQRLTSDLIGLNHWSLRLPALLGSLGTLALAPWLAERDTRGAGLGAALLLALSPFHVFYGHFARVYGLLALGAVLLLALCRRLASDAPPRRHDYAALAVLGALLPYLHLTATALVASLVLGLLVVLLATPAKRQRIVPLLIATTGAAVGALLLHAPAARSMLEFVRVKTDQEYGGSFGILDVLSLAASSRPVGVVLIGLVAVGLTLAARRRDAGSLLLAFGVIGPGIVLFAVRPYGDAYAYARYLIPSLTLLCLWVARIGATLVPAGRRVAILGALLPALLLGASIAGSGWPTPAGPHGNTYLSILSLPAFDAPWPGRSGFYAALGGAGTETIVEAPALVTRSRHLHRSAYLAHRRSTLLGFLPREAPAALPAGPYVAVDPGSLRGSGADLLLLHRDAAAEVARYWAFVYGPDSAPTPDERAFMERHRDHFAATIPATPPELVEALRSALGAPSYEDADVLVWRLRQ